MWLGAGVQGTISTVHSVLGIQFLCIIYAKLIFCVSSFLFSAALEKVLRRKIVQICRCLWGYQSPSAECTERLKVLYEDFLLYFSLETDGREGRKINEYILMGCLDFLHSLHTHIKQVSAPMTVRYLEMVPKAAGESTCSSHTYSGDSRRRSVYSFKFKAGWMSCLV